MKVQPEAKTEMTSAIDSLTVFLQFKTNCYRSCGSPNPQRPNYSVTVLENNLFALHTLIDWDEYEVAVLVFHWLTGWVRLELIGPHRSGSGGGFCTARPI